MEQMNEATENPVTVSDEEAADFARVAAMAGGEVAQGGEPVPEPEAPQVDAAESMAGLLTAVSSVAGFAGMKNVAGLWAPEVCHTCAEKTVPVLRKYPWGQRVLAFFETGAGVEEMALGAFLVPMGLATWKAIDMDMQPQDKPEAKAETPGPVNVGTMREVHGHADQ